MEQLKIKDTHEEGKTQSDQLSLPKDWRNVKNHLLEYVIGDVKKV